MRWMVGGQRIEIILEKIIAGTLYGLLICYLYETVHFDEGSRVGCQQENARSWAPTFRVLMFLSCESFWWERSVCHACH